MNDAEFVRCVEWNEPYGKYLWRTQKLHIVFKYFPIYSYFTLSKLPAGWNFYNSHQLGPQALCFLLFQYRRLFALLYAIQQPSVSKPLWTSVLAPSYIRVVLFFVYVLSQSAVAVASCPLTPVKIPTLTIYQHPDKILMIIWWVQVSQRERDCHHQQLSFIWLARLNSS